MAAVWTHLGHWEVCGWVFLWQPAVLWPGATYAGGGVSVWQCHGVTAAPGLDPALLCVSGVRLLTLSGRPGLPKPDGVRRPRRGTFVFPRPHTSDRTAHLPLISLLYFLGMDDKKRGRVFVLISF